MSGLHSLELVKNNLLAVESNLITVIANGVPYQDAKINQYGTTTQNGNNIDFYLAVSDVGNASADGYFYCDITFLLQDITP